MWLYLFPYYVVISIIGIVTISRKNKKNVFPACFGDDSEYSIKI